jgi:hypothetical protein
MDDTEKFNISTMLTGFQSLAEKTGKAFVSVARWFEDNSDVILEYVSAFVGFGQFLSAVDVLKNNQIVFTDNIDTGLANQICSCENVEKLIEDYFFIPTEERANKLITRCEREMKSVSDIRLFDQVLHAYKNGHYQLACIGLFAIIDGVLSDLSNNTTTSFQKRVDVIKARVTEKTRLSDLDKKTIVICLSINEVRESMCKNINFSDPEPVNLNRNWLLHGRTDEDRTRFDFIKEMLFLDAIQYVGNLKLPNENEN